MTPDTTPTDDDTAALVAEARKYAAKQTEFAALWLPEHPKTARETQYPADLLTRLAAALEAATAREGRMPVEIVARAICKAKYLDPDEPVGFGSDDYVFRWEEFTDAAHAALGDTP